MRSPTRILLALAGVVAVVAIAFLAARQREPVYQRKPLGYWLDRLARPGPETMEQAKMAIDQIGTNTLPFMLSRLGAKDSWLTLRLMALARQQFLFRFRFRDVESERFAAVLGFCFLGGERAKLAIPSLRLLLKDDSLRIRTRVVEVLSNMGSAAKEAVPDLILALDDPEARMRSDSMVALMNIHETSELTLPAFISRLGDIDATVRGTAVSGLRGLPAEDVVPLLWKALRDPKTRQATIPLLKDLGWPEATKARVKEAIANADKPQPGP